MCIATAGFYGTKGPFWSMPSMILTGTAAAAGIAWINSIGNVGGAVGPALVGWIKDFHRQLLRRALWAGGLYRRVGADCGVCIAHPTPDSTARQRQRRSGVAVRYRPGRRLFDRRRPIAVGSVVR